MNSTETPIATTTSDDIPSTNCIFSLFMQLSGDKNDFQCKDHTLLRNALINTFCHLHDVKNMFQGEKKKDEVYYKKIQTSFSTVGEESSKVGYKGLVFLLEIIISMMSYEREKIEYSCSSSFSCELTTAEALMHVDDRIFFKEKYPFLFNSSTNKVTIDEEDNAALLFRFTHSSYFQLLISRDKHSFVKEKQQQLPESLFVIWYLTYFFICFSCYGQIYEEYLNCKKKYNTKQLYFNLFLWDSPTLRKFFIMRDNNDTTTISTMTILDFIEYLSQLFLENLEEDMDRIDYQVTHSNSNSNIYYPRHLSIKLLEEFNKYSAQKLSENCKNRNIRKYNKYIEKISIDLSILDCFSLGEDDVNLIDFCVNHIIKMKDFSKMTFQELRNTCSAFFHLENIKSYVYSFFMSNFGKQVRCRSSRNDRDEFLTFPRSFGNYFLKSQNKQHCVLELKTFMDNFPLENCNFTKSYCYNLFPIISAVSFFRDFQSTIEHYDKKYSIDLRKLGLEEEQEEEQRRKTEESNLLIDRSIYEIKKKLWSYIPSASLSSDNIESVSLLNLLFKLFQRLFMSNLKKEVQRKIYSDLELRIELISSLSSLENSGKDIFLRNFIFHREFVCQMFRNNDRDINHFFQECISSVSKMSSSLTALSFPMICIKEKIRYIFLKFVKTFYHNNTNSVKTAELLNEVYQLFLFFFFGIISSSSNSTTNIKGSIDFYIHKLYFDINYEALEKYYFQSNFVLTKESFLESFQKLDDRVRKVLIETPDTSQIRLIEYFYEIRKTIFKDKYDEPHVTNIEKNISERVNIYLQADNDFIIDLLLG